MATRLSGSSGQGSPMDKPEAGMDHIVNIFPDSCEKCRETLTHDESGEPSSPLRHQKKWGQVLKREFLLE